MCLALFVAADIEPPLVAWDPSAPAFNVVETSDREHGVRKHLSKPHVRYAGAHTGCSCGFVYGEGEATSEQDRREEELGRASVRALRAYLDELLRSTSTVELYACWEGEWDDLERGRRHVTSEFFGGDAFRLPERELLIVSRPGATV